jgi:flavin reductase (DIM6/NTAB) family NADH-FMN oxidoreductase RutF
MSQDKMLTFDPQHMVPKDVYRLLINAVVPRPIVFVSTLDVNSVRNLAPFSFFTVASSNPPVVVFCTSVPSAGWAMKDTLRNVLDTREFVLNIVSEDFAKKMNECSATVLTKVDEFKLSGLTPIPKRVGQA